MTESSFDWRAGDLKARWKAVLQRLHAVRTYPHRFADPYRWEVVSVGDDGADLILHAYFRNGERYCCCDPVCNFDLGRIAAPLLGLEHCSQLRRAMAEECIDHLNRVLVLELRVTVEGGSVFHSGEPDAEGKRTTAAFSYRVGPFEEPEGA